MPSKKSGLLRPPLYLLSLCILLLCACSNAPKRTNTAVAAHNIQHMQLLSALTAWQLRGRIALQTAEETWTASIHWRQSKTQYDIDIIAPFGQGTYKLTGDAHSAALRLPDGSLYKGRNLQALLDEHLGWELHIEGLTYWLKGLPAPKLAMTQQHIDDNGRWLDFMQAGWKISILSYMQIDDLSLPKKLYLQNDKLKVRFSIYHWS